MTKNGNEGDLKMKNGSGAVCMIERGTDDEVKMRNDNMCVRIRILEIRMEESECKKFERAERSEK